MSIGDTQAAMQGCKQASPNEVWPYDAACSSHRIEYPNAGVYSRAVHNVRHPAGMEAPIQALLARLYIPWDVAGRR